MTTTRSRTDSEDAMSAAVGSGTGEVSEAVSEGVASFCGMVGRFGAVEALRDDVLGRRDNCTGWLLTDDRMSMASI